MRAWNALAVLGAACLGSAQTLDPAGKYAASTTHAWQIEPAKLLATNVKKAFISPDGKWVLVHTVPPPAPPNTPLVEQLDLPDPQLQILSTTGEPSLLIDTMGARDSVLHVDWSVSKEWAYRRWGVTVKEKNNFLVSIQVSNPIFDATRSVSYYTATNFGDQGFSRPVQTRGKPMVVRSYAPGRLAAFLGADEMTAPEDRKVFTIGADGKLREYEALQNLFQQGWIPMRSDDAGQKNLRIDGALVMQADSSGEVPQSQLGAEKFAVFNASGINPLDQAPNFQPSLGWGISSGAWALAPWRSFDSNMSPQQNNAVQQALVGVRLCELEHYDPDIWAISLDESAAIYSVKGDLFLRQISPMDFKEYQRLTKAGDSAG